MNPSTAGRNKSLSTASGETEETRTRVGTQDLDKEFFIDKLLLRIHFTIEMIWWTGLTPWEFGFPFSGSLISAFQNRIQKPGRRSSSGSPCPRSLTWSPPPPPNLQRFQYEILDRHMTV